MNIQDRAWRIGTLVGILLALFLAVLSIKEMRSIAYVGKSDQIINSINVTGKGEEIIKPDIATFSFSVSETAKTVTEAQSKATEKINAALKAIRDAGVKDEDIKTAAYNINPHYEYQNGLCNASICRPGKNILTGYEVSQTIEVKVRDLTKAGALFELIGSLGVQNVNNLVFSVDDIDSVKSSARAKAIDDAKSKAKELARQLGVRIVRIVSFNDQDEGQVYYARDSVGAAKAQSANVAPEVPAGQQKVTSNVLVIYEIR